MKTLEEIKIEEQAWIEYNKRYAEWEKRYEGRLTSMEAGMSEPNKPGYFRANND